MTDHEQKKELIKRVERQGWESKKFRAFLLMETLLSTLAILALYWQRDLGWPLAAFMTGIVFTMGYIAINYTSTQARLDMFVRGMALGNNSPAYLKKFQEHLPRESDQ